MSRLAERIAFSLIETGAAENLEDHAVSSIDAAIDEYIEQVLGGGARRAIDLWEARAQELAELRGIIDQAKGAI